MAVTPGSIAALVDTRFRKVFLDVGVQREREYSYFLNEGEMPWNPMTDQQIAALGVLPRKAVGAAFTRDEPIMGGTKTWEAEPWGMAAEFTKEAWRDELFGAFTEIVAEMTRSAFERQELNAFGPINDAFAGATFTGYDGLSLCHTAHTRLDGGATQANRPSPEIGFSRTGIEAMLLRFHRLKNERGITDVRHPVMALVGPQNVLKAREELGSSGRAYTADREINALIQEDMTWQVVHRLDNEAHWHFVAAKGRHDVWYYLRDPIEYDTFDDPWTGNAVCTVYFRDVAGFGSWKGWDGSTG